MQNAAIYLNPEAYNTSVDQLMGRHSAGESFLKGFLRHADVPRFFLWNVARQPAAELTTFLEGLAPISKPVTWIGASQRSSLKEAGAVFLPTPHVAKEAWSRQSVGASSYSICGVTHTTATTRIMDAIGNLLLAPLESWDALICTSRAVRASVEAQLEAVADDLRFRLERAGFRRLASRRFPSASIVRPLRKVSESALRGASASASPGDALVALYVGRFNPTAKMNPIPMFLALERAQRRTRRPLHYVLSGWAPNEKIEKGFRESARQFSPSVTCHFVDGRKQDVRFSIWAMADFFLSFSDNVQETFGLTPLEAMAAGVPGIVSDWDGYRDTVRHGLDGFRVSTFMPRAGLGRDLASWHATELDSYNAYVGKVSQFAAVDLDEATEAICELVANEELRSRMGKSAQEHARNQFDWRVIIPRYQELWAELSERRLLAAKRESDNRAENPWRLDPFRLFSGYPTESVTANSLIAPSRDNTTEDASEILASPFVQYAKHILPSIDDIKLIIDVLKTERQIRLGDLLRRFPEQRRVTIERGIPFLAKYGLLTIFPRRTLDQGF